MEKRIFYTVLTVIMCISVYSAKAQYATNAIDVKPLMVGQEVPDKMLTDGNGNAKSLHTIIGDKPTVILFYRGDWCGNCINHFNSEIVPNLQKINSLGYNIIFIRPDDPEHIRITAGKISASPSMIYSDAAGDLSVAMGIAWQQQERMLQTLAEHSGGKNKGFVPVISSFVVGADKTILFEDIRPDGIRAASRIKGNLLMAILENLQ